MKLLSYIFLNQISYFYCVNFIAFLALDLFLIHQNFSLFENS